MQKQKFDRGQVVKVRLFTCIHKPGSYGKHPCEMEIEKSQSTTLYVHRYPGKGLYVCRRYRQVTVHGNVVSPGDDGMDNKTVRQTIHL